MSTFNITEVSERILQLLEERGLKGIKDMRSVGFGLAIRYFRQQGKSLDAISIKMLDAFMLEFHRMYESERYSTHTWELVRHGVGLVKHYVQTGEILDRRLPPWTHAHNPLRVTPTPEQLVDNNNVWGLIWRVREELKRIGFTPRMCIKYNYGGFDKILRLHIQHEAEYYSPDLVNRLVAVYYARYDNNEINRTTYSDLRKAGLMLCEFHATGAIKWKTAGHYKKRQPTNSFGLCIDAYHKHAKAASSLATTTIRGTISSTRSLVFELEDPGHYSFETVTLLDISNTLTNMATLRAVSGISGFFGDIRRFLKFLYHNDYTKLDLSIAIPECVAQHRSFGYGFSKEETLALVNAYDTDTALDKRDFAMITLAAQTGLRSIDIVNLKRDNIDWRAKEIRLVQSKTGKPIALPLEPESGNAIADYLLNARPECDLPNIFIIHTNPIRPISSNALQARVRKSIKACAIDTIPGRGTHGFRRGFGTRLLEGETPIELLHQMLGQTSIESAKPYLSVNDKGLKMCALGLVSPKEAGESHE